MDVYTTEEQQVEAIKKWWRDNGKAVVIGAIIGLGGLYGWRYYQAEQATKQELASDAYAQLIETFSSQPEEAEKAVSLFAKTYQDQTSYTELASLQLAKTFIDKGDLTKAAEQLRLVMASSDPVLQTVASLRFARVETEMGNYDVALNALNSIKSDSWKAQSEELKGDIALRQGNVTEARTAYTASLQVSPNQYVQMKLDNLSQ